MSYDLHMITMTDAAIAKVREIAEAESLTDRPLRLKVQGGGCSGFQYDMYFDDADPTDFDEVFDCSGTKVIVDPLSLQYLDGTEVDYVTTLQTEGFKFSNPKVKGTCGCGSSFSA